MLTETNDFYLFFFPGYSQQLLKPGNVFFCWTDLRIIVFYLLYFGNKHVGEETIESMQCSGNIDNFSTERPLSNPHKGLH